MQIMPDVYTQSVESQQGVFMPSNSNDDNGFYEALTESIQADADESNDQYAYMADSPYSESPETYSQFVPQEVRLTPAETDELAKKLSKDGLPLEVVEAVREMGKFPGGPTMDMVMNAALEAAMGKDVVLSKQEQATLSGLANKLAALSGNDPDGFSRLFAKGSTPQQMMNALMGALKQNGDSLSISREEMAALTKALNLPQETRNGLLGLFGEQQDVTLSGDAWHKLLGQAGLDVAKAAHEKNRILESLEAHSGAILKEATRREELERQAAMGETRDAANRKALIKDVATQAAPGREDLPDETKQTRLVSRESLDQKQADSGVGGKDALHRAAQERSRTQANEERAFHERNREGGENFARQTRQDSSQSAAPTSTAATAHNPLAGTLFATSVNQGVGSYTPPAATAQNAAPQTLPSQALDQIEQAILTANKSGVQKLEVSLNPVELGALSVTLVSRNGELSAVIRSERAETASMITQQTEQIKAELESQGIKVDKVDVQTGLNDTRQNWQGMDQHNSTREYLERSNHLETLRLLGRSGSGEAAAVARNMQINGNGARIAEQGLHIVA